MFALLHRVTTGSGQARQVFAFVNAGLLAVAVTIVLALGLIEMESAALGAQGLSEDTDLLLSFLQ
jgi:hypothetical protein